jgi:hypothetical protein
MLKKTDEPFSEGNRVSRGWIVGRGFRRVLRSLGEGGTPPGDRVATSVSEWTIRLVCHTIHSLTLVATEYKAGIGIPARQHPVTRIGPYVTSEPSVAIALGFRSVLSV